MPLCCGCCWGRQRYRRRGFRSPHANRCWAENFSTRRPNRTSPNSLCNLGSAMRGARPGTLSFCNRGAERISSGALKFIRSADVSSRTSPSSSVRGLRSFIPLGLSRVCFSKADHSDAGLRFGETEHMKPAVKITHRHVPHLAMFSATIDRQRRRARSKSIARSKDRPR